METLEMNSWDENGSHAQGAHPPPEQLMLAVDGELSPAEAAQIEAHLAACWLCRARTAKIEITITDFIEYSQTALVPQLTPPPEVWRNFGARLDRLANKMGQPSLLARLGMRLRGMLTVRLTTLRLALAASIALVVVIGFWLNRSDVVSAHDLLQRSMQAERARLNQVAEPVIYRKLRARRKSAGTEAVVTWESWRSAKDEKSELFRQRITDAQGTRFVRAGEARVPPLLAEIERMFRANRLDFERPLSARSFADWRAKVRLKTETVSEVALDDQSSGLQLTAVVAEPQGPDAIVESSLIVRRSNWRPVAQYLKAQVGNELREYELSELACEIAPLAALTIFAEPMPLPTVPPAAESARLPSLAPSIKPTPAEAELQNAEITTLYALHQLRADLGEQLEVLRDPAGRVIVRGLVETAERKEQLIAALSGLSLVTTQIQTVEEAQRAATQKMSAQPTVIATAPDAAPISAENRPVQQQAFRVALTNYFAASGATTPRIAAQRLGDLTNQSLSHSEAALARAWAIRRLAENPTLKQATSLSVEARLRLAAMLVTHQKELQKEIRDLRAVLEPGLTFIAGDKVMAQELPTSDGSDWTEAARAVFRSVSQLDRLLHRMFSADGAEGAPAVVARNTLADLAEVEAALRWLEAQIGQLTTTQ